MAESVNRIALCIIPQRREGTIEECVELIRAAWDTGDAAAFAAKFKKDQTHVVYFGAPLGSSKRFVSVALSEK